VDSRDNRQSFSLTFTSAINLDWNNTTFYTARDYNFTSTIKLAPVNMRMRDRAKFQLKFMIFSTLTLCSNPEIFTYNAHIGLVHIGCGRCGLLWSVKTQVVAIDMRTTVSIRHLWICKLAKH
jgi:hypothetical protein